MRVTDYINSSEGTAFSFEVLPPLKGTGTDGLFRNIDKLMEFAPGYINITTHHSEPVYRDMGNGMFALGTIRRRPGTVAVAAAIHHRYNVPVVPHILCNGYTLEDTEYALIDLQLSGITDILVLRGDRCKGDANTAPVKQGNKYAIDLQRQVNRFNEGFFVDGTPMKERGEAFSYGVACYPEKHEEAMNMDIDIEYLKAKINAGAKYVVTQMFFDNNLLYNFLYKIREAGITVPVIPGIMPITNANQIDRAIKLSGSFVPQRFKSLVDKFGSDPDAMKQAGIAYATDQIIDLYANGVQCVHVYSMNKPDVAAAIRQNLSDIIPQKACDE